MHPVKDTQALERLAEQAVPEDIDLWPRIRSRIRGTHTRPGTRRLAFGAAGAALMLVLVVAATALLWPAAQPASAEAILDRAQAAVTSAAAVRSYHLIETLYAPASKGGLTITREVWFAGRDRQRSRTQTRDGSGAILSTADQVTNGAEAWISMTDAGQTRAVHTTNTKLAATADIPGQQDSLTELLAAYDRGAWCMNARLDGEGTVAGQATYVIALSPRPGGCGDPGEAKPPKPGAAGSSAGPSPAKAEDLQLRIWVDKVTFLPLKTEARDSGGAVLKAAEVTDLQLNVTIDSAVFVYAPPAGATVSEYSGAAGEDLKQMLSGSPAGNGAQDSRDNKEGSPKKP